MQGYLIILTILFVLTSCTVQDNKETDKADNASLNFEFNKSYHLGDGLSIKNIKLDSTAVNSDFKGISVSFVTSCSNESLKKLHDHSYSAYFLNVSVLKDDHVLYSYSESIKKSIGKQIHWNRGSFISEPGEHNISYTIPFFNLQLPEGTHSLSVLIEAIPAKFSNDTTVTPFKKLEYIGAEAAGRQILQYSANAPALTAFKLSVNKFELEKKTKGSKKKLDFAFTGKGLPDLFWQLRCGDEILFTSDPVKNSHVYNRQTTTPLLYCSKKDQLSILIFDYDQGPFNSKDLISKWQGTLEDLESSRNPLEFGSIKDFSFQTELQVKEKTKEKSLI